MMTDKQPMLSAEMPSTRCMCATAFLCPVHDATPAALLPTSAASEPVKITYSGLTYILGRKAPEGLRAPVVACEACDAVMPMTNDAMYEHAAKCPAKGWAHGV